MIERSYKTLRPAPIEQTRRVPQVRCLNLGLGVAVSSCSTTSMRTNPGWPTDYREGKLWLPHPLRLLQRVGPLFSSSVIPPALLAPSFEGSVAEGTGATAPSAVAEWRDRGSILPRTDDKWAGGASAPFASAVFWTPRLLQRVAPASSLFLFSHASLLRKLKTYD